MDKEAVHITKLLKRGSTDGFRKAAARYGPYVYALALEITGNRMDAEEVTSDTLMKVFRHIASFQPDKGSLKGWLLRIAHNSAISALRRRQADCLTDPLPENIPVPEEDSRDDIELVKEAIDVCSTKEKSLIHMYYYDDLPLAEIAEITGVATGTLAVRLQRLRQKIKQYILTHHG